MKMFMEAQLGKPQSTVDLGAYLENDRKVLRLECVWDDSNRLYGDVQMFRVHYFLSDDTMEVVKIHEKNSGRDPVPKLLGRRKLLKNPELSKQGDGDSESHHYAGDDTYHWTDFTIGSYLRVYERDLLIIDADAFTFGYYEQQGQPLGAPMVYQQAQPPTLVRAIPPHTTGIGSEEDSLRSVFSINPKVRLLLSPLTTTTITSNSSPSTPSPSSTAR
jgi:hypothetical protein